LISGVMTGVTAGAIIGIGIAFIAGLRFAAFFATFFTAFFLEAFFFEAFFFEAGFFLADFFFAFLATRFFDARFLDDFFFAFLAFLVDFFFAAFFFAAMVLLLINVDRVDVRNIRPDVTTHYQASGFASNKLVIRFYADFGN
jgi:hypothetical protein